MKSIEELALKVTKEMWNRNGVYSGHPLSEMQDFAARFLSAYTAQQEPFAHICVLPTADAGPTKFFTSASDPRGFPVFRHAAPIVPDGMVLVPRESTDAMREAFKAAYKEGSIWNDRLDAALMAMIAAGEKKS